MSLPDVVSRAQWLEARQRLLAQEKDMTRARDELNAARRRLPMVRVGQEYVFEARTERLPSATCSGTSGS
jgi:predicted dithiol-disulfide oxidoreductase (DUF899 family)